MATPKEFVIKTKEQIRDDFLRTVKQGLINRGIENPNVSEGTYDYLIGSAIADFGALVYQNTQLAANANLPDSALGNDLERLAGLFGLFLTSAGPSTGSINFTASVASPIGFTTGAQLIDPTGLTYFVSIGGTYDSTQAIPIESTDTGVATNLAAGTTLRWVSPPPFVDQVATVSGPDGLTGGIDAENIEGLRQRLLSFLKGPPNQGENFSAVNLIAEQSSSGVQKAFSYPGVYGPGTAHVVVIRAQTETSKERDIDALLLATEIAPNVLGQLAEFTDITVTTVTNEIADVSIAIDIPYAKTASPPGPGGGWLDAIPFPTPISPLYTDVIVVAADILDVTSFSAPVVGGHIVYVSPTNWKIYHAKITAITSLGGNDWRIELNKGLYRDDSINQVIQVGDWIFPDAVNMDTYIESLLNTFGGLGPGQKTNSPGLIPRAYRKPLVNISYPSDLNGRFIKNFQDGAGDEVVDVFYAYIAVDGNVGQTSPTLNNIYQEPPNILVPHYIGFYPS